MTARFVLATWITHILIALLRESGSDDNWHPLPLGCHLTKPNDPAMPDMKYEDDINMNQEMCIDHCSSNELTFAGVQDGSVCWCSDVPPKHGPLSASLCRTFCRGNKAEYCGGKEGLSVFAVCDEGYYGPKCELPCMCQDYAVCNFMTGICPNGKCQGDWKGKRCDEKIEEQEEKSNAKIFMNWINDWIKGFAKKLKSDIMGTENAPETCESGYYGIWCRTQCHCSIGTTCDRMSGVCESGTCAQGWLGKRCDKPDACAAGPCANGGQCNRIGFTMHCQCTTGYSGSNCEIADPCTKNPCINGGQCVATGKYFTCQCGGDFSGRLCESDQKSLPSVTPTYLGCFKEVESAREFTARMADLDTNLMTPIFCSSRCKARFYTYAGLQYGKECWCSNSSYGQYGKLKEKSCDMPCSGDDKKKCGAAFVNSVYSVCNMGTYKTDCTGRCHCLGAQCDLNTGTCPNKYCQVGYTGDKCDQPSSLTSETYKRSKARIAYSLGFYTALVLAQTAIFVVMTVKNSKGNNKDEAKKPGEENDKEGQKDELEALLNGNEKDEA